MTFKSGNQHSSSKQPSTATGHHKRKSSCSPTTQILPGQATKLDENSPAGSRPNRDSMSQKHVCIQQTAVLPIKSVPNHEGRQSLQC